MLLLEVLGGECSVHPVQVSPQQEPCASAESLWLDRQDKEEKQTEKTNRSLVRDTVRNSFTSSQGWRPIYCDYRNAA